MIDAELDELDPVLAAAYQAERRVTANVVATAGITRERVMFAACSRVLRDRAVGKPVATPPTRARWAIAAGVVVAASIGYATARLTAPAPAPVRGDAATITPMTIPADAAVSDAPPDAIVHDAPIVHATPRTSPTPPPAPTKDSPEALLLDQARAALRRHLPDDARVVLERHRRAFPNGQLREERDVLLIEVALLQDRRADANELIARYLDQYPSGSLRQHVLDLQHQLDKLIHH